MNVLSAVIAVATLVLRYDIFIISHLLSTNLIMIQIVLIDADIRKGVVMNIVSIRLNTLWTALKFDHVFFRRILF